MKFNNPYENPLFSDMALKVIVSGVWEYILEPETDITNLELFQIISLVSASSEGFFYSDEEIFKEQMESAGILRHFKKTIDQGGDQETANEK